MTSQATFQLRLYNGTAVITAAGEIDITNVDRLRSSIADAARAHSGPLVISFEGVTYLDSHTLATLVDFGKSFSTNRRRLLVVAPKGGAVERVMRITNLSAAIPVYESVAKALASIA